jgi:hypothetical protein
MKRTFIGLLFGAACIAAGSLWGQGTTVNVPFTGAGKDAQGRSYTISGSVAVAVPEHGLEPIQLLPDTTGVTLTGIGDTGNGSLVRVTAGQPLVFTGTGFGTVAGKVWLGTYWGVVTSWTDTRIVLTGAEIPTFPNRLMIGIQHPTKGWTSAYLGPYVMPSTDPT